MQALFGQISHGQAQRIGRFVRRNLGFIDPASIGVTEEIVARFGFRVCARQIKSPRAVLRLRRVLRPENADEDKEEE